jgi:voltage-gated potassium channel
MMRRLAAAGTLESCEPTSPVEGSMSGNRRQRLAGVGTKVRKAPVPNLVERRMSKFLREPPSIRIAASVIVTATAVAVVGGGILIRLLDHKEYGNIWVGMWWALQTVTTVGYGDVTPKELSGRVVAAFVMLEGISFLAIITAAVTATFVARAERERDAAEEAEGAALGAQLESRLNELSARFDRLESLLLELGRR